MSTPVSWEEVEECVERGDPEFLSFQSHEVLARHEELGDVFLPVQELKQTLPDFSGLTPKPPKAHKPRAWGKTKAAER